MIKFIKFSFTVINVFYIKQIDIQPSKFIVHLNDNKIKGNYNILKFGDVSSQNSKIEICNKTHPNDYMKMSHWIENLK